MAMLKITGQTVTPKIAVCKLEGDLDVDGFDPLEDEFDKYLNSGVLGVIMDVSGLDSFCSSGMGAILSMSLALRERSGKLVLMSPKPDVLGTLEMLGLQEAAPIAQNIDAARKLLSGIPVQ